MVISNREEIFREWGKNLIRSICGNRTQKWVKSLKWSLKKQSEDAIGLTSFIRRTTVFS